MTADKCEERRLLSVSPPPRLSASALAEKLEAEETNLLKQQADREARRIRAEEEAALCRSEREIEDERLQEQQKRLCVVDKKYSVLKEAEEEVRLGEEKQRLRRERILAEQKVAELRRTRRLWERKERDRLAVLGQFHAHVDEIRCERLAAEVQNDEDRRKKDRYNSIVAAKEHQLKLLEDERQMLERKRQEAHRSLQRDQLASKEERARAQLASDEHLEFDVEVRQVEKRARLLLIAQFANE